MATVELHHEVAGPGDAPVVVLLHAIGTSLAMWDPQAGALEHGHRTVRVDLRGHGGSPVVDGPASMADLAGDVIRLLDDLEVERASICGLSLGGMVGLQVAASHPDRVDRLVAACVTAKPASPQAWLDRARAVRTGGTRAIEDLVLERWGYTARAPEIGRLIVEMLAATPAEGYAACCEAIAAMDLGPDLPRVTAPTLLLVGADDPAAPAETAREMAAIMPDARVVVIDGAAHLANVERPVEVTGAILQHLGRADVQDR
jgi:3-oxoadipate enol-lactonase